MNNVFLIGKISYISDIKFKYTNRLKIYCEFEITVSANSSKNINEQIFLCILVDDIFDKFYSKLKTESSVYIIGSGINLNGYINIIVKDILFI